MLFVIFRCVINFRLESVIIPWRFGFGCGVCCGVVVAYIVDYALSFVMVRFVDELFDRLKESGYPSRVVSVERLGLLQRQICEQRDQGLLDDQVYRDRLEWFRFEVPEGLRAARSLIVVAVPRPMTRAVFVWGGVRRPLVLPPTYTAYGAINDQIKGLVGKILSEKGYSVAASGLPLKLLAVRSGLGEYGRNNLCYVSGMGSFLQLVAVYSDMPCERIVGRKQR